MLTCDANCEAKVNEYITNNHIFNKYVFNNHITNELKSMNI